MYEWCDLPVPTGLSLSVEAGAAGVRRIEFGSRGIMCHSLPLMRETLASFGLILPGTFAYSTYPWKWRVRISKSACGARCGPFRMARRAAIARSPARSARRGGAGGGSSQRAEPDPHHRALPSGDRTSGNLVGYGGGLAWKRLLLGLEASYAERFRKATA